MLRPITGNFLQAPAYCHLAFKFVIINGKFFLGLVFKTFFLK